MENNGTGTSYIGGTCLDFDSMGPHYEHISEFQTSFFKSVYKRAFLQLKEIIQNFRKSDKYGDGISGSRYGISGSYEGFCNIITFEGKRGSGKTSAMMSFIEALKNYLSYKEMTNSDLLCKLDDVGSPIFICLDCIDGSLLEHGEDIFKVVLAQMYQKFTDFDRQEGIHKGEDFAYRKRELLKQLEDIYRTVCDIEDMEKRQVLPGESYMSSLQSLSSSQKVKRDFGVLIHKFTSLVKYEQLGIHERGNEHYVVISIDDLDLNISNGFSMLEKIHRYCIVQNVIVLLSVDMEQMLSIVSKNFYKVLPKVDKLLRDGEKRVHELSVDYLNKVMPSNYRISIPDISDYHSADGLSLKKENMDIKRSIFGKLYRRIGICFDSQGIKQHFYEPKSMRQLTCFYLMLETMEHVGLYDVYGEKEMKEEEKARFIQGWEENYRILIAELSNRIVTEKLYADKEVLKLCERIRKENIRRAKDEVVNFYYMRQNGQHYLEGLSQERSVGNGTDGTEKKQEFIENCSYGQLIEKIFALRREEGGRYKVLVHYLLGYFSYAFTKEYLYEKHAIKSNDKVLVEEGTFKSLIGKNVVDKWSVYLMPFASRRRNTDIEELGTISDDRSNKYFDYYSNFKKVLFSQVISVILETEDESQKEEEKFQYVAEVIRDIELVFLFFTNIREDGQNESINTDLINWKFEIKPRINGDCELAIQPYLKDRSSLSFVGDFSVLNFVGNSMYAAKTLEKVEDALLSALSDKFGLRENNGVLKPDFMKVLEMESLKSQFEKWEAQYGKLSLPLPLFWFDLTYNLLKRVRRKMNRELIVSVNTEDMFLYIKTLYHYIEEQLGEQEEFFFPESKSNEDAKKEDRILGNYQLKKRFTECPVVKYFLEKEEGRKKEFIRRVMKSLRTYSQG